MRNPCKMTLFEVEMFLNKGSEDGTKRSLTDPWYLQGEDLLFDPQVLLNTIMLKAGECAPLFSNAATFYNMNKMWWEKHRLTFQKLWEVVDDVYNPLWTNDTYRTLDEHTKNDGTANTRAANAAKSKHDDQTGTTSQDTYKDETKSKTKTDVSTDITKSQSLAETENGVSAFDAGNYSPHDISESRDSHTESVDEFTDSATQGELVHNGSSVSGTTNLGHTESSSEGTTTTATQDNQQHTVIEHEFGNNSVLRTPQKMVEQEIELRSKYNIYDIMADIFCDEMIVWVYV